MLKNRPIFIIEEFLSGGSVNHSIEQEKFSIGRSTEADLRIEEVGVSRVHVIISLEKNCVMLEDQASKNGTRVNDKVVPAFTKIELKSGDLIQLGNHKLIKLSLEEKFQDPSISTQLEKTVLNQASPLEEMSIEPPELYIQKKNENKKENGEYLVIKKDIEISRPVKPLEDAFHQEINQIKIALEKENQEAQKERKRLREEAEKLAVNIEENARQISKDIIFKAEQEAKNIDDQIKLEFIKKSQELEKIQQEIQLKKRDLEVTQQICFEQENLKEKVHQDLIQFRQEFEDWQREAKSEKEQFVSEKEELVIALEGLEKKMEEKEEQLRDLILGSEKAKRSAAKFFDEEQRSLKSQVYSQMLLNESDAQRTSIIEEIKKLSVEKKNLQDSINEMENKKKRQMEEIAEQKNEAEKALILIRTALVEEIDIYKQQIDQEALTLLDESEAEVKVIADKIQADFQTQIKDLEHQKYELFKLKKEVEETNRQKAKEIIDEAQKQAETTLKNADKWAEDNFNNTRRKAEEELEKIRVEKKILIEKVEDDLIKKEKTARILIEESQLKAESIIKKAVHETEEEKKRNQAYIENERKQAENLIKDLLNGAEKQKNRIDEEIRIEKEKSSHLIQGMIDSAQKNANEIERVSKENYHQLKIQIENERNSFQQEMNKEREKMLSHFHSERERLLLEAKNEYEDKKKKDSLELSAFKMKQIEEVKEKVKQEETEFHQKRREEVLAIANNINKAVQVRIQHLASHSFDAKKIEELSQEIQMVVRRILNDEAVNEEDSLKSIMQFDSKTGWKARRFWRRMGYVGSAFIFIFLIFQFWPNLLARFGTKIKELASTDKSLEERFLDEIKKQRESKPKFLPPQTDEFKSTYVENVLYTTDFVKNKLDKNFQEKWIQDLNKFFLETLKLNENIIVNFISRENSLIKDLQNIRETLQPSTAESGINRMKEIEQSAIEDFKKILSGNLKYRKFKEFERNYYSKKETVSIQPTKIISPKIKSNKDPANSEVDELDMNLDFDPEVEGQSVDQSR